MTTRRIKKILLIDDDDDDFFLFKHALRQVNKDLDIMFYSHRNQVPPEDECEIPDIAFLDVNMPEWDGFEWLKRIRKKGFTFPVVMYSTAKNGYFVQRAYTEGADLYVQKAASISGLASTLDSVLSMDWNNPKQVASHYQKDGRYYAFGEI